MSYFKIPLMALITLLCGEQSIAGQIWKQRSWGALLTQLSERRQLLQCAGCRIRILLMRQMQGMHRGAHRGLPRGESWAGQVERILQQILLKELSGRPEPHLTLFFIKWFLNLKLKFKKIYKKNLGLQIHFIYQRIYKKFWARITSFWKCLCQAEHLVNPYMPV